MLFTVLRILKNKLHSVLATKYVPDSSTYIAPSASVHNTSIIGANVTIAKHTTIERNVRIGDNVRIGPCVLIASGTEIHDNVTIGAYTRLERSVTVLANVTIRESVYIDKDSVIRNGVTISSHTIIFSPMYVITPGTTDIPVGRNSDRCLLPTVTNTRRVVTELMANMSTATMALLTTGTTRTYTNQVVVSPSSTQYSLRHGPGCSFLGVVYLQGDSKLGSNCVIGHGVTLTANVIIGNNVCIGNNVIIGNGVIIEDNSIISSDCCIERSCILKANVRLAPICYLTESVILQEHTRIGSGLLVTPVKVNNIDSIRVERG